MPITIYCAATPSQLQRHWRARLEALWAAGADERVRVVVPTERLQRALQACVPSVPAIVSLERWLAQALPQHIMRIPPGTWEFLAELVPDAVLPKTWRSTPGVREALALWIAGRRDRGIRPSASDAPDLAAIWAWFEEHLPETVADRLRLYAYAEKAADVLAPRTQTVMVYGFAVWPEPWRALLGRLGERRAVELWMLGRPEEIVAAAEFRNARICAIDGTSAPCAPSPPCGYPVAPEDDPVEALALCLKRHGTAGTLPPTLVLADPADERVILRALRRHGMVDEGMVEPPRERALWRLFWLATQGGANGWAGARWCAATGEASDAWARAWGARVEQIARWEELAALLQEAAERHRAAWSPLREWADALRTWEGIDRPTPERVRRALTAADRAWDGEARESPWPVLTIDEALWRPSEAVFLLRPQPRPRPHSPFDRLFPSPRLAAPSLESQDPVLLRALLGDPGLTRWIVGETEWVRGASDILWLSAEEPAEGSAPPAEAERVRAWYQAWQEAARFSAYTGGISPAWVPALFPSALSPSAVEDFGRCPLSFLLGRLLNVSPVLRGGAEVDPGLVGEWAHRALEIVVRERRVPTAAEVEAAVAAAVKAHPAPPDVNPFYLRYQEERLASELLEALLRDDWSPATESWAEVELTWDSVWPMRGRVDRIDALPDGSLRLIDYKTGRLDNPLRPHPANLQLALYQGAVAARYQKPVEAELYGITQRAGFAHRHLPWEANARIGGVVDWLLGEMKQRMEAGQYYPLPSGRPEPCRACSFRLVCPAEVAHYAERKLVSHRDYQIPWQSLDEEAGDGDADSH
ncbi:MAG: PD-(D/E)XK nuclease family protein [Firmicutes bacterium]|nr:PD-(D/E)XK nuclease family protein [Bacillota bacterium]